MFSKYGTAQGQSYSAHNLNFYSYFFYFPIQIHKANMTDATIAVLKVHNM